jgi:hypothetical protein
MAGREAGIGNARLSDTSGGAAEFAAYTIPDPLFSQSMSTSRRCKGIGALLHGACDLLMP